MLVRSPGKGHAAQGGGHTAPMRLFEAVAEPGAGAGQAGGGLVIELACGGRMTVESPVQVRLAAELLGMLGQTARFKCEASRAD